MLIGEDFEKISVELFGATLLEPNAFVGDTLIFIAALYLANQINKLPVSGSFFSYWKWFFIIFGLSFFVGGFSHLFYDSWGVSGKYFPWYSSIFSVFFLELAMISIYPNQKTKSLLQYFSISKLVFVLIYASYIYSTTDLSNDHKLGLMIPTINSVIGMGFSLVILGLIYERRLQKEFKYFWMGGCIIFPSAIFQFFKINIDPWMDRNDISHVLILVSSFLYFQGIKGSLKVIDENDVEAVIVDR